MEVIPEMLLELTGSAWPPAAGDIPQGTAAVGEWSVNRTLTGGALPGQVRGASGHSIATGSTSFAQPEGAPLSPWGKGALNLGPGGKCILYATHADPGLAQGLRLGNFVVAPISGSNTSNAVDLELDEDSIRLQKPFTLNWVYDPAQPTFDASWVLGQIAASAGLATDIESTGSPLRGVFGVAGASAWSVAQSIAAATMGAVWISEAGVFTYRNRHTLRGVGGYTESIEALDSVESLPWTIDPADIADRVELTYAPTEIVASSHTSTLWEATDPIRLSAGQTITVNADVAGTTDRLSPFVPIWPVSDPNAPVYADSQMSRWAAASQSGGGGVRPSDTAIRVTATMSSPSRARITITNTTGGTLWLVDGNGNPTLILRTNLHIQPGEPVVISSGVPEAVAVAALEVDAGAWVQDASTAQEILSWLTGQTSRAQATLAQVRVKPDLARQMGDTIRLTDGHTGLRSKALVTGVSLAGGPEGYTQSLDLALMDVIFADFDTYCIDNGIITFADLDAFCIANNLNTFAELDAWLTDFGGNL